MIDQFAQWLRCPDCRQVLQQASMETGLKCGFCGRLVEIQNNLALCLPAQLPKGSVENLQHYNSMAKQATSHLKRRSQSRNHRLKQKLIIDALKLKQGRPKFVMEIGTALGAHAVEVIKLGHTYLGTDLSPGLLRAAVSQNTELAQSPLVAADATCLPLANELFDAVYCVGTLHHLPDPGAGIREMMRVLKPGGTFCILEPRRFYPVHLFNSLVRFKTEISALKISEAALRAWMSHSPAQLWRITPHIFTPNRPLSLLPLYDWIDNIIEKSRFARMFAIMLCVHGTK